MMRHYLLLLILFTTNNVFSQSEVKLPEFKNESILINGSDYVYKILYPIDFSNENKYPVILFLHGAGERGNDNEAQLVHGKSLFLDSIGAYPAIVIFPQCPKDDYWASVEKSKNNENKNVFRFITPDNPTNSLDNVIQLLDHYLEEPYVDANRIYLSGLSMGGMGTFELLWRRPNTFAAAIPICGGGAVSKAPLMRDTPLWIIHGTEDMVVPPFHSIRMMKAIQKSGGTARISLYKGLGHNSWDRAFSEPDYFKWLFSHALKK